MSKNSIRAGFFKAGPYFFQLIFLLIIPVSSIADIPLPPLRETIAKKMPVINADGDLSEWANAEWINFGLDEKRWCWAAVGWSEENDKQYINLAFKVNDISPLMNAGGNPNLLYKTGDCVEFCVSSNPDNSPRQTRPPIEGDKRVLITEVAGESIAMLYEPKSNRKEKIPGRFYSPTGEATYDHVAPLKNIQIGIKRYYDMYIVEVVLDAAELGFEKLHSEQRLRTDFGVLFSDRGGHLVLCRAMWSDNDPDIGGHNDIPAEARIHPQRWGWVILK